MIRLIVQTAPDAENVLTVLPRYGGWELVSEEISEDGSGAVVAVSYRWDDPADIPVAVKTALDTHAGVVSYCLERGDRFRA